MARNKWRPADKKPRREGLFLVIVQHEDGDKTVGLATYTRPRTFYFIDREPVQSSGGWFCVHPFMRNISDELVAWTYIPEYTDRKEAPVI